MSMKPEDYERIRKKIMYAVLDVITVDFSILASVALWYDGTIPGSKNIIAIPEMAWQWFYMLAILAPAVKLVLFALFGFYKKLWRYTSSDDFIKVVILQTVIFLAIYFISGVLPGEFKNDYLPKRILLAAWSLDLVLFVLSRFGYRLIKRGFIAFGHILSKKTGKTRVMIVGGGYSGFNTVRSILRGDKGYTDRIPIIAVDDDLNKNNTQIHGVRIVNGIDDIPKLAEEYEIEEIIVAIPSATNIELKRIMKKCSETDCVLKTIPPISDFSGSMKHKIRDVNITDLLFRDEIKLDVDSVSGYIKNHVVLVTGGGGSIGSELCRQIARFLPKQLIIFDIYENNAYELMNELNSKYGSTFDICVAIGSVRDYDRVMNVCRQFKPYVIFHAAAHKHVPLMQNSPSEAVKNNIFGTINVARCADITGADRFVLLSTDKAVNPTNVMGATKRVTELIIQYMAAKSSTKYMAVRFGNVLGSNGSVIPLFKKQIEEGGPVTVTHPDIVRYFMTIPEASRLVLQAAGMGKSGRIFVLDMGEPVKIDTLARNLIKLSGFIPDKDIKIKYVGLRPGEKLFEELIMAEEQEDMKVTYHNKIFITKPFEIDSASFEENIERLKKASECNDDKNAVKILKDIVPTFNNRSNANSDTEVEKLVSERVVAGE